MECRSQQIESEARQGAKARTKPLRGLLLAAVMALTVFALYARTLDSPFVFDDVPFIKNNAFLAMDHLSLKGLRDAAFSSTRPLANLSFALNHYLGGNNPEGCHLVNMTLHVLAGMGIYFLAMSLFSLPWLLLRHGEPGWRPAAAALLWLVHPVHTASVTYIVQRSNIMAAMFCIWSFYCYVRARTALHGRKTLWLLSVILWALALASKETALCLPFAILLFEWFFLRDLSRAWLPRLLAVLGALAGLTIAGAYLFLGAHPLQSILYGYGQFDFTLGQRLLTEFRVLAHYASLVMYPSPSRLVLDYDFPVSTGLFSPVSTFLCMAGVLAALGLAIAGARKHRLASFAALWFFLCLLLESSFVPLDLVFEHRLYLPMVFPVIALAVIVLGSHRARVPAAVCLAMTAVLFSVWTYQRNEVWEDDLTLWRDTVTKAPGNARAHNNYGLALANSGNMDQAVRHFRKALALRPGFGHANYNMGIVLARNGNSREAARHFEAALRSDPENTLYLNDLALSQKAAGNTEQALATLYKALRLNPGYAPTRNNLGIVLAGQGALREALSHFQAAVDLQPDYGDAHLNLGIVYCDIAVYDHAIEHLQKALSLAPSSAQAHFFLGKAYAARDEYAQAAAHFKKAALLAPNLPPAYYNAGLTLMALEQYEEAALYFQQALILNPQDPDAKRNLDNCLEKEKTQAQGRSQNGEPLP